VRKITTASLVLHCAIAFLESYFTPI